MQTDDFSKRPLVEQICDELFANIEKHKEFDDGLIGMIKQLATTGELKKHGKVMAAIREMGVEKHETA